MLEKSIYNELLQTGPDKIVYVSRLVSLAKELLPVLENKEFCEKGSYISRGKVYGEDELLILMYEFYLVAKKFESIPTYILEVYLYRNADALKILAANGRLSGLIGLM